MVYQTDLKESEWDLIKTYFEPTSKRGSSHKHEKKQIVNGILYLLKGGITWRLLPNDFPPGKQSMITLVSGTKKACEKQYLIN